MAVSALASLFSQGAGGGGSSSSTSSGAQSGGGTFGNINFGGSANQNYLLAGGLLLVGVFVGYLIGKS